MAPSGWNRPYGDYSAVAQGNAPGFTGYAPPAPPVPAKDNTTGPSAARTYTHHSKPAGETNMPRLGATFVPGGFDDYYMPEVIAPAPQRVMPEVPQNMQDDLQRMELEAHPRRAPTHDPYTNGRGEAYHSYENQGHPTVRAIQEPGQTAQPFTAGSFSSMDDAPSFTPFPKVKGENIPPSNEEMEETLSRARDMVLHSNNVPMQVAWARDTLAWIEIQSEAAARDWKQRNKGRDRERPATPKVEHDLRLDAVSIIQYLASQDHPEATFMKAKWQEFGKFGQRENKKEAYLGYKKAATLGWGRAEYRIGMLYENSNDTDKAIKHYDQGVALKDSAASYRLGMMYLMGQHGYPKDSAHGLEMIQMAADTADGDAPQGAYVYGMLIARELPDIDVPDFLLPLDLSLARQYIEKAAYLGFAKAQLKMGQAFELSQLGCDFKPTLSLHYYALAAQQGQAEASLGVSRWFLFGYENEFAKNEKMAFQYGETAADAGLPTGEFAMGYYYEIGIHVPKDIRQARIWYERAAEHGNKDSARRLEELDNSRTLTKKDHETTTLTRIKSQHGSQRGKRPDRFTRPNETMQTVTEAPNDDEPRPAPPVKGSSPPRPSPQPSPRGNPVIVEDHIEFPDPERQSTLIRPPAFTINLDQNNLAMRPKSTAPYPEDDRPPPLTASRPKSTAPYPDDDMVLQKPQLSPHFNPSIRPSSAAGPHADRPMSAFGIRPQSQTSQALQPTIDPRGRSSAAPAVPGWEPQVPSSYRQPSPGSRTDSAGYRQNQQPPQQAPRPPQHYNPLPSQRLTAPGSIPPAGTPIGDPLRNRLQKPNPGLDKPHGGAPGPYPGAGYGAQPAQRPVSAAQPPSQPGRDYGVGPRTTSRPISDTYDRYGAVPPAAHNPQGRYPPAGNATARVDTLNPIPPTSHQGHAGANSGGASSQPPQPPLHQQQQQQLPPLKARPGQQHLDPSQGRSSAPPGPSGNQGGGPTTRPGPSPGLNSSSTHSLPAKPSATAAATQKPVHPDGKTIGQGPATFEEMGIPQGKTDSDCVVM